MTLVAGSFEQARQIVGERRTVCSIGVFDGVHIGHQELIGAAVADARARSDLSAVVTFRNHPLSILAPAYAPSLLTDPEEKIRRLQLLGPSLIVVVEFSRALADIKPDVFVRDVLCRQMRLSSLWCGPDFRFGRQAAGDVDLLGRLGERLGFVVQTVEPVRLHGGPVSSTRIRSLIEQGQVEVARQYLGGFHVVRGDVVRGDGRGEQIGFPTANVNPLPAALLPCDGAYVVRVEAAGETWGGMMNLGPSPTFGVDERRLEVHLFDFHGDLVGQTVSVHFIARLRDIVRFDSVERLAEQIRRDERRARAILREIGNGR